MRNIITPLYLISIFKNVLNDFVVSNFIKFLEILNNSDDLDEILKSYSNFVSLLYKNENEQNFYNYLKKLLYSDENIISQGCTSSIKDNQKLIDIAKYELSLFDKLIDFDYEKIKDELTNKFTQSVDIIEHLPYFSSLGKTKFEIEDLINSYKHHGFGIFSCFTAFKYTKEKEIIPIKNFEAMTFEQLKNYEYQKSVIKNNTKAFVEGKEANNILLYGDRGCGKSSTVKALINEFSNYDLKIIQVYKQSFVYLSDLYEKLRNQPAKFIIFADDISFEEDDKNFSSIKVSLEGSLSNKPKNVIIYATSNRMHLVKESFSAREGNEIHYNDTIDEMTSLSDRFGIMLTFSLLTKTEYLDIVTKIANDCCIKITDDLYKKAEEFSALKSIRTPRVARQFIVDYMASM
jgi:hypothetical protein